MNELSEALDTMEERAHEDDRLPDSGVLVVFLTWRGVSYAQYGFGHIPDASDLPTGAQALVGSAVSAAPDDDLPLSGIVVSGVSWCWPKDVWLANFSMDMDPPEVRRRAQTLAERIGPPAKHPERMEVRWSVARTEAESSAVLRTPEDRVLLENPAWRGHLPLVWLPALTSEFLRKALETDGAGR